MKLHMVPFLALLICVAINGGYASFVVSSFEDCNPGFDYPIKMDASFKTVDDKQFLDVDVDLPVPADDTMQLNFSVEALADEKSKPIQILSDVAKNTCSSLHKHLGEFIFDLERRVNIEPGVCPIPVGTYKLRDYSLDFDKIPIKNFPFGVVRVVLEASKTEDHSVLLCKIIKVNNVSK